MANPLQCSEMRLLYSVLSVEAASRVLLHTLTAVQDLNR